MAVIAPARPDRQYILSYQAFYIWRAFSVMKPEKVMAGFVCSAVVYLTEMFSSFLLYDNMASDDRAEVVKQQT